MLVYQRVIKQHDHHQVDQVTSGPFLRGFLEELGSCCRTSPHVGVLGSPQQWSGHTHQDVERDRHLGIHEPGCFFGGCGGIKSIYNYI